MAGQDSVRLKPWWEKSPAREKHLILGSKYIMVKLFHVFAIFNITYTPAYNTSLHIYLAKKLGIFVCTVK